jgi:tRNA threonylcarbamoyladenosine biosynthesis protein TsaB
VIVLGIETSTPQTSVAIGTEREILGAVQLTGKMRQDSVVPAVDRLLSWTGLSLQQVGGISVGLGPGLFTGLRVGVEAGKSLAQVLSLPIVGVPSLDVLAFGIRYTRRLIGAVIDARRGEVFFAFYRSLPGGVVREGDYEVGSLAHLAAEVQARPGDVLLAGNGAILYRHEIEEAVGRVEFASSALAFPQASALVELTVPRFIREDYQRPFDVMPLYLRKSDAEIAWDQRTRGAPS